MLIVMRNSNLLQIIHISELLLLLLLLLLKNEVGGACSTYGGEERCIGGFVGET